MAEDNIQEIFEALTVEDGEDLEGKLYGMIST